MTAQWSKYFTPSDVGDQLVKMVQGVDPRHAIDICAGRGHLLLATRRRWTRTKLFGNDLFRKSRSRMFESWSCKDGRRFAVDALEDGRTYDLVVANPPFGRTEPLATSRLDLIAPDARRLLASHRMECAMMTANALLVSEGGVLAAIVPRTMLDGATYAPFRDWLATSFRSIEVERLSRRYLGGNDLGLAILIATKTGPGCKSPSGGRASTEHSSDLQMVAARRGRLMSSQLKYGGTVPVLHCGGMSSDLPFSLRACSLNAVADQDQQWAVPGDIIVVRIGRRAGEAIVYEKDHAAVLTDCVFVIDAPERVLAVLRPRVADGTLGRLIAHSRTGLGAEFCTKGGVEDALSLLLSQQSDLNSKMLTTGAGDERRT
jgi:hypothetical protein